jgi:hypothetical protein
MGCKEILGQGLNGIVYLTTDNKVIKIEPVEKKIITDGDKWGKDIVPTLNLDIQKHFMRIYSITFLKKNPMPSLSCVKGVNIYHLAAAPFYKKTILENAGKSLTYTEWTDKKRKDAIFSLLQPVAEMNNLGYYHNDLHAGNIVQTSDNIFKIIDYGNMTQEKTPNPWDIYALFRHLSIKYYIWGIENTRKVRELEFTEKDIKNMEVSLNKYIKKYKIEKPLGQDHMSIFHFSLYNKIFLQNKLELPKNIDETLFDKKIVWDCLKMIVGQDNKTNNKCLEFKLITELITELITNTK